MRKRHPLRGTDCSLNDLSHTMPTTFHGFRSLIENGCDATALIDTLGEILYASAAAAKFFGSRPDELLARKSLELIHQEDRAEVSDRLPILISAPPNPVQWHSRIR